MIRSKHYFSLLFIMLVLTLPAVAFDPAKQQVPGTIFLKNGEVLTGLVSPLGNYADAATVYRADAQSRKTSIAHNQIEKIVLPQSVLQPAHIPVDGHSVAAYLEQKVSGSASLYRAHFYAAQQQGKNNSSMQLQWSWVLQSPESGLVSLGNQPTPSQLAQYLKHPLLKDTTTPASQDETAIIEAVEKHNAAVRSVLSGIPNEERKQDR